MNDQRHIFTPSLLNSIFLNIIAMTTRTKHHHNDAGWLTGSLAVVPLYFFFIFYFILLCIYPAVNQSCFIETCKIIFFFFFPLDFGSKKKHLPRHVGFCPCGKRLQVVISNLGP
jgi:hypothetical protein